MSEMNTMQIKNTLKKSYDYVAETVELIHNGSDNVVYKATSPQGDSIVIRVSKRKKSTQVLEQEGNILRSLSEGGAPVPQFLKNNAGKYVYNNGHQKIICSKFITGKTVSLKSKPSARIVKSAAISLAKLHQAGLSSLNIKALTFERDIFTEVNRLEKMKKHFCTHYKEGLAFIALTTKYKRKIKELYNKEPAGFIHNDYRSHNVLASKNKIKAILDFDWATVGPFKKDLAHAALEWAFPDATAEPWKDVFTLFIETYLTHNLSVNDHNIKDWVVYSALCDAATFYIDRLPDSPEKEPQKTLQSYMHLKAVYFDKLEDAELFSW